MYVDALGTFSDAQALTGTADSTSSIDLGGDHNVGIGEPMSVVITLDVAADAADGDETYVIALETDDNSSFSSGTLIGSATITRGDVAGTKYVIAIPQDTTAEQYLQLQCTLGGTSPTVTITAFLTASNMIQNYVAYPGGFTVS